MMQQPSEDHPPGTVLEEYQSGYRLWDRVLRPAKVIVSAQAPGAGGDQQTSSDGPDNESSAQGGDGEQQ